MIKKQYNLVHEMIEKTKYLDIGIVLQKEIAGMPIPSKMCFESVYCVRGEVSVSVSGCECACICGAQQYLMPAVEQMKKETISRRCKLCST